MLLGIHNQLYRNVHRLLHCCDLLTGIGGLDLILGAILLLFLASVIHSWYSANAAASETAARGEVAIGFIMFGRGVLAFSVVLLIIGLVLLWIATGRFHGRQIAAALASK